MVAAERELFSKAAQMSPGDLLEGAVDAPLEQAKEGLGSHDMHVAADAFLCPVANRMMPAREMVPNTPV
jgi:hypothetical protein